MAEIAPGSGVTTRDLMRQLQEASARQFEVVLRGHLGTRSRHINIGVDAFRDGMRTMLRHLVAMGVVAVIDE